MKTELPPYIRLADYTPPAFLIDHVDLTVRLDGPQTVVRADYKVRRNPSVTDDTRTMTLDSDGHSSASVTIDGDSAPVELTETSLSFPVPDTESFEVTVETKLDPDANKALSGLYRTNGVYCTQCEAEGFRRIVPALDRPDVLATYCVRLEARSAECPVLLSNGNPGDKTDLGDGWVAQEWHDPHPKPSYLFALVGGALDRLDDRFKTKDGRDVALAIYVEPGKSDQAGFAMEALKCSMRWDETRFGRAYDLDVFNIVAVSDFNLGAMENKGLNIFNDKYILASPETATDTDYQRIEAIIAHEYFHNWTGNRITCRDWFQLCLKEGLTVYRDQEYTSDTYDRTIKRIEDVRTLWTHQFPEDGGPLAHPVRPERYREINNFYTATVYEKGAEIVRMLALWLGDEAFRRAMDRYFEAYDGQAVRIEEFLACMQAQDADPDAFPDFMSWYQQAGTPALRATIDRHADGGSLTVRFQQTHKPTPGQSTKKPLPIPSVVGLVAADGADVPVVDAQVQVTGGRLRPHPDGMLFLLESDEGSITFKDLPNGAVSPSILRGFSAPVELAVEGLSAPQRLALATHDSDGFNSWSQLQTLYSQSLQERYQRLAMGEPAEPETALFEALVAKIDQARSDPSLHAVRATELTMPSAHDLARTIGKQVEPSLIQEARDGIRVDFCKTHGSNLIGALETLGIADNPEVDAASAATRSLKLALLVWLSHADDDDALSVLQDAHTRSVGMTMRIGTLSLLVRRAPSAAKKALASFEDRFSDSPLAMDKWLSVQATAYEADALPVVRQLMQHAGFSLTNPNRVRALVGAFAMSNLAGFHAADGTGYRFVGDCVARIDADNPQLAARLASAFRTWRQFGRSQQDAARQALETIAARPGLSRDLSDIVGRTLEAQAES